MVNASRYIFFILTYFLLFVFNLCDKHRELQQKFKESGVALIKECLTLINVNIINIFISGQNHLCGDNIQHVKIAALFEIVQA